MSKDELVEVKETLTQAREKIQSHLNEIYDGGGVEYIGLGSTLDRIDSCLKVINSIKETSCNATATSIVKSANKIDVATARIENCIIMNNINKADFTSSAGLIEAEESIKSVLKSVYGDN